MKIFNSPSIVNKPNYHKVNFKSAPIAPVIQTQVQNVVANNATRGLFAKLAGIAGLTSIIAWVKTLSSEKFSQENLNKLDIIDTKWTSKANELFLNPNTTQQYLDVVSKVDDAESVLWTEALLAESKLDSEDNLDLAVQKQNLFLDEKSNSTFLSVSANKTVKSILAQINALVSANEEVKAEVMSKIEDKLNSLINQAEELKNSEKTAEVYSKLSNIAKMFTLTTLLSSEPKAEDEIVEVIEPVSEAVEGLEEPTVVVEMENVTPIAEIVEPKIAEEPKIVEETKGAEEPKIVEETKGAEEPAASVETPKLKVVGRIDLSAFSKKEAKVKPELKEEIQAQNEIPAKHEEFVKETFLKAFGKKSKVKPEMYYPFMDDIKRIYDSYYEEKEKNANLFLKLLAEDNKTLALDNYIRLTKGQKTRIEFINFLTIESIKQKNGGSITPEEFALINDYKDSVFKYFTARDDEIEVAFCNGVSAEKRLEFIKDLYKMAFNKTSSDMHSGEAPITIRTADVIEDISYRYAKNNEDYPNSLAYLGVNDEDLDIVMEALSVSETITVMKEYLSNAKYRAKLEALTEILNNEDFDNFIDRPHSRMRVVERFVFDDSKNLYKNTFQLMKKTSTEIKKIRAAIEKTEKISFTNYSAQTTVNGKKETIYGPRVKVKDYTIAINDAAQIHTIW